LKTRRVENAVPGGERIFQRIYTRLGCEGRPPHFVVDFHPYTDLTHTIRLREDTAYVRLSDALDGAPHPVMEATAAILLGRLYRREPPKELLQMYREFSYAGATRRRLLALRQRRARRVEHRPAGTHHDLDPLFERLNARYFAGELAKPRLGWSRRVWSSLLGCFDPALQQIVINRQLDRGYEVLGSVSHSLSGLPPPQESGLSPRLEKQQIPACVPHLSRSSGTGRKERGPRSG
jgi:hypothetical protein